MVLPLIVLGGAMAAGGVGASMAGLRTSGTAPKSDPYQYGGSQQAADAYRAQYAAGVQDAQGQLASGITGLQGLGTFGQGLMQNEQLEIDAARRRALEAGGLQQQQAMAGIGRYALEQYKPGEQSRAMLNLGLAQAQRNALSQAAASGNSALATRNALAAGMDAQSDAGQQAALMRAQEEQFLLGARLQQANASNQALLASQQANMGMAGFGAQQQALGAQNAQFSAGGLANLGAGREATYLDQQAGMESQQLQARMAYEQARQQDRMDRRAQLFGLGAGLIGAGGNVMAYGGRGGGGGSAPAAPAKK